MENEKIFSNSELNTANVATSLQRYLHCPNITALANYLEDGLLLNYDTTKTDLNYINEAYGEPVTFIRGE